MFVKGGALCAVSYLVTYYQINDKQFLPTKDLASLFHGPVSTINNLRCADSLNYLLFETEHYW